MPTRDRMPPTRQLMKRAAAPALAVAALLTLAVPASAAQRHASPTSSDVVGSCTSLAPCRIDHAINAAAAGDEVIVQAGTYDVNYSIDASVPVHVRGIPGQPRPRIVGAPNLADDVVSLGNGGSLFYLYVEANRELVAAVHLESAAGGSLVVVNRVGTGVELSGPSVLRNSFVRTEGTGAAAQAKDGKSAGAPKVLGSTLAAVGAGSAGIKVKTGATTVIRNSVVRGEEEDVSVYNRSQASVDHSSFRPARSVRYTDAGGNQTGDPGFADGDFRLGPGSPLIDAGTAADALGTADVDGLVRSFGPGPDIGAYEFGSTPADPALLSPPGAGGTDDAGGGSGERPGSNGPRRPLPPTASPVAGERVNVAPVKGVVRVRPRGSDAFVELEAGASIPVDSVVDATDGVITLTSEARPGGKVQTGRFWGGRFRVAQSSTGAAYTKLVLVGGGFRRVCSSDAAEGEVTASRTRRRSRSRTRVRRLWGRDRGGRFRTRGRRGQATVRGTKWLTVDRCDGTLFKVRRGAVVVNPKAKGKRNRVVRKGERYLAR